MNNRPVKKGHSVVELVAVVLLIVLLATMAVPAFKKLRRSTEDNAVRDNLQRIAVAAREYLKVEGVSQVSSADLIGSGKKISTLESIGDETYDFIVTPETPRLTATINGRVISYDMSFVWRSQ